MKLDFAQPYLILASVIGEMKRNLVEKMMDYLVENHRNNRPRRDAPRHVSSYPETEISYLGNVTNALAAEFYRQYGVTEIEDGLEKSYSKQPGIKVMTTKHCIRYANGTCSKETSKKATPLILSNEKGTFRLEFDCRNCQMNVISMA